VKYISTLFLIVFYLGNLFSQFVDTTNHLQIFEKISSGFLINTGFLKTTKDLIINEERSNESLDQILQGETINYLKTFGDVYLVRPPIDFQLLDIENALKSDFDDVIIDLSTDLKVPYFNFSSRGNEFDYTDGHHLLPESADRLSQEIALKIKQLNN